MKLRIEDDIIHTIGTIHRLCAVLSRRDPDLAKQVRRAVNSVGLNVGEGLHAHMRLRSLRALPAACPARNDKETRPARSTPAT